MSDYDILIRGEIVKRKFVPDNVVAYQTWLDKHDGKRVQFALSRERKKRSNAQLEYYWGALIWECCKVTGLVPTERNKQLFHETFLMRVAKPMIDILHSRALRQVVEVERVPSTGFFDASEMSEYIERCKDYAAREWNVHVPDIDNVKLKGRR